MTYYHVTRLGRLEQLMTEGLRTGRRRIWRNAFERPLGDTKLLYFWTDCDNALRWAHHSAWCHSCPQAVLCFTDLPAEPAPELRGDPCYRGGVTVPCDVPWSRVRRVIVPVQDDYRQLVNGGRAAEPVLGVAA